MSLKVIRPLVWLLVPSKMVRGDTDTAQPILFTNKDKDHYGTIWGGLVTILIFFIMVVYLIILIFMPFVDKTITITVDKGSRTLSCDTEDTPTNPGGTEPVDDSYTYICTSSTTCPELADTLWSPGTGTEETANKIPFIQYYKGDKIEVYSPAYNTTEPHTPFYSGFNIGFRWRNHTNSSTLTFKFLKRTSKDSGLTLVENQFNTTACSVSMFPEELEFQLYKLHIEQYVCIDPSELGSVVLRSNDHGEQYVYLLWQVVEWAEGSWLVEDVYGTFVDIIMVDAAFSVDKSGIPIVYTLNLDDEIRIVENGVHYFNYRFRKNYVSDEAGKEFWFYSLVKVNEGFQYVSGSDVRAEMKVMVDDMVFYWQRELEFQPKIQSQIVAVGEEFFGGVSQQKWYWKV